MLETRFTSKLFVLLYTIGCGMFAHASGEVVYGVPFGRKKVVDCGSNLTDAQAGRGRSADELAVIFEKLLGTIRMCKTVRVVGDLRGIHTWQVEGAKTVTISILRRQGGLFHIFLESPTFVRNFLVVNFERQQLMLTALGLSMSGSQIATTPGPARVPRDVDGIVL